MSDETGAFHADAGQHDMLDWSEKKRFQAIFTRHAVRSYVYLSFGMGLIAFSLPILLLIVGGYTDHYSISFFYHVGESSRNIFVGCLWATGAFLFLFHGLSELENWILNIAGVAAVSVAMNPMASVQTCGGGMTLHFASAIVFFLCLAIVAVFLSKGRIKYIIYPPKRRRFKLVYTIAGVAMIAMPSAVAAIHFLSREGCESHWIFWVECFGIWAFSLFWFVKTLEYRLLLGVR